MNPKTKLRVFLADDHQVLRDGLKALINAHDDMTVVGEAADGVNALELVGSCQPEVVVMDISMPKLGGAAATRQIKTRCAQTYVLALTAHEDCAYAQALLDGGASGFVLKRSAAADLVHAIRVVAAGGVYLDPTIAGELLKRAHKRSDGGGAGSAELSEREREVIRLVAEGHAMKTIAYKLDVSVRTLETYKSRAMEKLALTNRADIVRYAVSKGWL